MHAGNVDSLLNADGSSRYKAIVEGANLFITQDARDVLHASGCVLYKDASTNKGGVTSSSLEVLAALALSDTEFGRHMAVPGDDTANAPEFYQQYVQEIIARIETDANLEFACIEKEYAKQLKLDSTSNNGMGKSRHVLTDELSAKINALCELMNKEGEASDDAAENRTRVDLFADPVLKRRILNKAVPRSLIELVGLEKIIERVPDNYLKAIFTTYISSRYTYMHGIDSNEFDFYEYMQHHMQGDDDAM